MAIKLLFLLTDHKRGSRVFQHQNFKRPHLPPLHPVTHSLLYPLPFHVFTHPIHMRAFPHPYLSTPSPFHTLTFSPHPHLSTPLPCRTLNYPNSQLPFLTTCSAWTFSKSFCVNAAPTYTSTSTSGSSMANLKPKMTAVHDGQGRMAIYIDESVGQDAIVSHFAPRYQ